MPMKYLSVVSSAHYSIYCPLSVVHGESRLLCSTFLSVFISSPDPGRCHSDYSHTLPSAFPELVREHFQGYAKEEKPVGCINSGHRTSIL